MRANQMSNNINAVLQQSDASRSHIALSYTSTPASTRANVATAMNAVAHTVARPRAGLRRAFSVHVIATACPEGRAGQEHSFFDCRSRGISPVVETGASRAPVSLHGSAACPRLIHINIMR